MSHEEAHRALALGAGLPEAPGVVQAVLARGIEHAWGSWRWSWHLPVRSPYGMRVHPTLHVPKLHTGIDIPLPTGTPVLSCWDGIVTRVDVDGEGKGEINGNAVHVASGAFRLSWLHLSRVAVAKGANVQRGQALGLSGASGRVTGPHLHFQVSVAGFLVDPTILFPGLFFRS